MKNLKRIFAVATCSVVAFASFLPYGSFAAEDTTVQPAEATENQAQPQAAPDTRNFNGTVTFVGQWTNESRTKQDTTKNFTSKDDKLGDALPNPGLFRGAAKRFLGWSDMPQVGNGNIADGAKFFSEEDTVETAFPNGIPADAKLYGVYFSLNNPDDPLPESNISMGLAVLGGISKFKMNDNEVFIDKDMKYEDILPKTSKVTEREIDDSKVDKDDIVLIEKYQKEAFENIVNEVVLNAQFNMDKAVGMIVYRNPVVGYGSIGVLTKGYAERRAEGGDFEIDAPAGKEYTYIDLKVNLEDDFNIPEKIYLEFDGFAWRPIFVLGSDGTTSEKLNILDPTNDANLGNTKNSFDTLVKNDDTKVTFGVETKGNHSFVVRMLIRTDNEIIPQSALVKEGKSIGDVLHENKLTLRALTVKELKDMGKADAESSVVTISKEVAHRLAQTDGADTIAITGSVVGKAVADGGNISFVKLRRAQDIEEVAANVLRIGYIMKNSVTFEFESATAGKDLPQEIKDRLIPPMNELDSNATIDLTKFEDFKVEGGTWKFVKWYDKADMNMTALGENVQLNKEDLVLVGQWVFEEDKMPEQPKDNNSSNDKPKEEKGKGKTKAPNTADNSNVGILAGALSISAISLFALRRKSN